MTASTDEPTRYLAAAVHLDIFDVRGRRVRRLLDGERSAGTHHLVWDGRDDRGRPLGAGLYFLELRTPAVRRSLRVVRVP